MKNIRFKNSCASRIYYPCSKDSAKTHSEPQYFRRECANQLASWVNLPQFIFRLLTWQKLPCFENAPLKESETKYPVAFFSPGLGGSMDLYSEIPSTLAKFGYVVFVLEHECGAGAYAKTAEGEEIFYKQVPKSVIYEIQSHEQQFRKPFLEKRAEECQAVFRDFENVNIQHFQGQLDIKRSIFMGHSFGAASTVNNIRKDNSPISALILLDLWARPIQPKMFKNGNDLPFFHIGSEQFTSGIEGDDLRAFLSNCPHCENRFVKGTGHQQFSDACLLFPEWFARFRKVIGKASRIMAHEDIIMSAVLYMQKITEGQENEFEDYCKSREKSIRPFPMLRSISEGF